jgi:hypothetical protein
MPFSASDVLEHLDTCYQDPYRFFIDLSHGYFLNATGYLHLFADVDRWAIVFETAGYGNRSLSVQVGLYSYGNCLASLPRAGSDDQFECNMHTVDLVEPDELARVQTDFELVSLLVGSLTVRGRKLSVPSGAARFEEAGLLVDDGNVSISDLVRYLAATSPDQFKASEAELRKHLPADLPHLVTRRDWHHRKYYWSNGHVDGDPPRSYETYPMLAEVLASRDATRYRPTLKPNTH